MGGQHTRYSTTALHHIRDLQAERQRTGFPTTPTTGTRHATATDSPALIDLDLLDHIEKTAVEIVATTHYAAPTAGPAPTDLHELHEWADEATADLEGERRQIHDAMMLRQALEHAARAGNDAYVQAVAHYETCPRCHCWGLHWSRAARAALCANKKCCEAQGFVTRLSLQQVAERRVAREAALRDAAV
jgi:hypothetical protein